MASAQQIAAATSNLQQNAQAALPVIPNNGNPGGAYNMQPARMGEPTPTGPDLSWLAPSPYMTNVQNTITAMQQRIAQQQQQVQPQVALPSAQPMQQQAPAAMPVLPQQQASAQAVMPQQTQVVLPQMR